MNKQAFEVVKQLATARGLKINGSQFDAPTFGSWWVELAGSPPLRVVWDGKDRWLIVARKTARVFSGLAVWEDLWVGREEREQSPEQALEHVCQSFGKSPERSSQRGA
jgi:hypothetical protein